VHSSQFAICGQCGKTEELFDETVAATLRAAAAAIGFEIATQTIELRGLCKACRAGAV
jgi:Fur family zinc uptake transcriptional regulator